MRNHCAILLISFCIAACRISPAQDSQAELKSAHALLDSGNLDAAITQLLEISRREPGLKGLSRELGVAYYRRGNFESAAKYLARAAVENADDQDALQLLGLSYYFTGKPAEAIPPLEKVRAWNPKASIDAVFILGLCYAMTRQYPAALKTFTNFYRVLPDSAGAHLLFARVLLRQGFDPVAAQEAKKALALSPRIPGAHFVLGEMHVYKSEYAAAAGELEKELEVNPGFAPAMTRLGEAYSNLGRYADAESALQRSIWLDSSSAEPYVLLGKVLSSKKQPLLAERALQRALALDPNSYSAHFFLGQVYRELGKSQLAAHEMKIAAEIQQLRTRNLPR